MRYEMASRMVEAIFQGRLWTAKGQRDLRRILEAARRERREFVNEFPPDELDELIEGAASALSVVNA